MIFWRGEGNDFKTKYKPLKQNNKSKKTERDRDTHRLMDETKFKKDVKYEESK